MRCCHTGDRLTKEMLKQVQHDIMVTIETLCHPELILKTCHSEFISESEKSRDAETSSA